MTAKLLSLSYGEVGAASDEKGVSLAEFATMRTGRPESLQQKQNLLQELEKEKAANAQLLRQKDALKNYIRAIKKRLFFLFKDFSNVKQKLDKQDSRVAALEAENSVLSKQKELVAEENTALQARLNSIPELKKAIREVKIEMRRQAREKKENSRKDREVWGNAGYLIKDGKSTLTTHNVKIEVNPTAGSISSP